MSVEHLTRRSGLGLGLGLGLQFAGCAALLLRPGAAAAAAPQRIVCVGGALTETLYALGAQARLVGVDTTSLYPEPARRPAYAPVDDFCAG